MQFYNYAKIKLEINSRNYSVFLNCETSDSQTPKLFLGTPKELEKTIQIPINTKYE